MRLSERLAQDLDQEMTIVTKWSFAKESGALSPVRFIEKSVGDWAREQMEEKNTLLFIGACGIAVRAIAPCITDKLHDSPVLVMDEGGEYIIPILSGHVGGANELAVEIAAKTGAVPVITTATDRTGRFAVDLFAKKNGLHITCKNGIARISAKVLAGKEITMSVETGHLNGTAKPPDGIRIVPYPPEETVDVLVTAEEKDLEACLHLKPKEYIIGMGCRRGKETERIEDLIARSMEEVGIRKDQVFALASIDRKKEEKGFLTWSRKERIPYLVFSAQELQQVEGDLHSSAFVKEQVGIDNVCERAALRACGEGGRLVYGKHAEDGMTIAIAKREWSIGWEEQ